MGCLCKRHLPRLLLGANRLPTFSTGLRNGPRRSLHPRLNATPRNESRQGASERGDCVKPAVVVSAGCELGEPVLRHLTVELPVPLVGEDRLDEVVASIAGTVDQSGCDSAANWLGGAASRAFPASQVLPPHQRENFARTTSNRFPGAAEFWYVNRWSTRNVQVIPRLTTGGSAGLAVVAPRRNLARGELALVAVEAHRTEGSRRDWGNGRGPRIPASRGRLGPAR